jgi:hypothetical protein
MGEKKMQIIQKIKDTSKTSVSSKLLFILLLNALDGILTYISVTQGYAIELNPIVITFVESIQWIMIVKISIPSLLILVGVFFLRKMKLSKPAFINFIVNFTLFIYLFVLLNHMYIFIRVIQFLVFY